MLHAFNYPTSLSFCHAVLSVDVLDISGTAENDATVSKGMDIHKIRLDASGKRLGSEYMTPQSQQFMDDGGMVNINVPLAMKVGMACMLSWPFGA